MLIINIEDCRIAFGCPDSGSLFDNNKIQKDFLFFFWCFHWNNTHAILQNNPPDALLSLAKCYWLQTTKQNTTQSLCSLPGLLIGDSFPSTHLVTKDVSFMFSLLCMGMFKIQIKEVFIKKPTNTPTAQPARSFSSWKVISCPLRERGVCKVTALLRPTKSQISGQRESNAQFKKNPKGK